MTFKYTTEMSGCPVGCRYCAITKVDSRRTLWNKHTILGLNKAVTILNPPPDLNDASAIKEFYRFPVEILRGDYVGFNAISDPLWGKYAKERDWFLETVSPVAKLTTFVTKFPIKDDLFKRLARYKNFRLVVSITGLDSLEKTKTKSRLETLAKAKEYGVEAFPICHPYVSGMSDLSFLKELLRMGYSAMDVKGLRYNDQSMRTWMPAASQMYYEGKGESEVLPEDGWRQRLEDEGIRLKSLKSWYRSDILTPKLSPEEAKNCVAQVLELANITSSASNEEVIREAVLRRL